MHVHTHTHRCSHARAHTHTPAHMCTYAYKPESECLHGTGRLCPLQPYLLHRALKLEGCRVLPHPKRVGAPHPAAQDGGGGGETFPESPGSRRGPPGTASGWGGRAGPGPAKCHVKLGREPEDERNLSAHPEATTPPSGATREPTSQHPVSPLLSSTGKGPLLCTCPSGHLTPSPTATQSRPL